MSRERAISEHDKAAIRPVAEPLCISEMQHCHCSAKWHRYGRSLPYQWAEPGRAALRREPNRGRHAFENLLLLCSVHHRIADDQPATFTVELLREMKEIHERGGLSELSREAAPLTERLIAHSSTPLKASQSAQVIVRSPSALQPHHVVIKTDKNPALAIQPTHGAIGHDLAMRNYTLHLINRYNDFQKWDTSKPRSGKYTTLYRVIRTHFGCKWDFVAQSRFHELIEYLQHRILNTKLGRIKNSRGQKCFSTWKEWLGEHHPRECA